MTIRFWGPSEFAIFNMRQAPYLPRRSGSLHISDKHSLQFSTQQLARKLSTVSEARSQLVSNSSLAHAAICRGRNTYVTREWCVYYPPFHPLMHLWHYNEQDIHHHSNYSSRSSQWAGEWSNTTLKHYTPLEITSAVILATVSFRLSDTVFILLLVNLWVLKTLSGDYK